MAAVAYSSLEDEGRAVNSAGDAAARAHPTIHEIRCKTLLNRVRPPMPFRWSINPYRGCAHACACSP